MLLLPRFTHSLLLSALFIAVVTSCQSSKDGEVADGQFELLPYKTSDRWGYLDQKGKSVINPQFFQAGLFHDGLAQVENTAHKIGYINTEGKFVIAPAYEAGLGFSEGLACVIPASGQITFVDANGKAKFVVQGAREARSFHEGLAAVRMGEKWGYVDADGRLVIPPSYSKAGSFVNGKARVEKQAGPFDGKAGFIDKNNQVVVPLEHAELGNFAQSRALVKAQDKYGYLDEKGAYAIRPQFDRAGQFAQGLAPVQFGKSWGFVDESGKIVINPSYAGVLPFSANGMALAMDNSTKQVGYLDREGKWIITAQFEEATPFYGNVAFAKVGDKWGMIDKTGKFVENPTYDGVYQPDLLEVLMGQEDPAVAVLNRDREDSNYSEIAPTSATDATAEVAVDAPAIEAGAQSAPSAETPSALPTEEQLKAGAPTYLRGTWRGKIGAKPLTLQIDEVNGDQVNGWNQVGNNRRPVTGTYRAWIEGDECGFELKMREPGDDKWDGKFELQVTAKEGGALNINHCYGSWKANNGKLTNDVQLDK